MSEETKKPRVRVEVITRKKGDDPRGYAIRLQNVLNELTEDGYVFEKEPLDVLDDNMAGYTIFAYLQQPKEVAFTTKEEEQGPRVAVVQLSQELQELLRGSSMSPEEQEKYSLHIRAQALLARIVVDLQGRENEESVLRKHSQGLPSEDMMKLAGVYAEQAAEHDKTCTSPGSCPVHGMYKRVSDFLRSNAQSRLS